jgi:hypothetical protein
MLWPKKKSLKLRWRSARQVCETEESADAGADIKAPASA